MTNEEKIQYFLSRANEDLDAAELLIFRHPNASVSRAYYAMFYAVEALLHSKGLAFKKHAGVIAAFQKEFVNAGELPAGMGRQLRKAYGYRLQGDYGSVPVKPEEAEAILEGADDFVAAIELYLKEHKNES